MPTRTEKLLALIAIRSWNPGVGREEIMKKTDELLAHKWLGPESVPEPTSRSGSGPSGGRKGGNLEDAKAQIRDALMGEAGGDADKAKKALARMTAFVVSSGEEKGKEVPGKSSVDALTDKQVWRLFFQLMEEGRIQDNQTQRPFPRKKAPPPAQEEPDDLPF